MDVVVKVTNTIWVTTPDEPDTHTLTPAHLCRITGDCSRVRIVLGTYTRTNMWWRWYVTVPYICAVDLNTG